MTDPSTEERLAALMARRPSRQAAPGGRQPAPGRSAGSPSAFGSDATTATYAADLNYGATRQQPGNPPRILNGQHQADQTAPLTAVRFDPAPALHWTDSLRDSADRWLRSWSPSRLVATGASAVSFTAMVVAMGPLLSSESSDASTDAGGDGSAAAVAAGTEGVAAPQVTIAVDPSLVNATGLGTDPAVDPLVALDGSSPETLADPSTSAAPAAAGATTAQTQAATAAAPGATAAPATAAPAPGGSTPATPAPTQPPVTAAPTTAKPGSPATKPPATQPPATQPPATQPPATQPPATQPPTTQPPTTKPPTTQPPTTQPPTTAPPTSAAS